MDAPDRLDVIDAMLTERRPGRKPLSDNAKAQIRSARADMPRLDNEQKRRLRRALKPVRPHV